MSAEDWAIALSMVAIALAIVSAVLSFWNEWRSQQALKEANAALVKITEEASTTRSLTEQSLKRLQEAVITQMEKNNDTDFPTTIESIKALSSIVGQDALSEMFRRRLLAKEDEGS